MSLVESVELLEQTATVSTLSVADAQAYLVGLDATWVRNCDGASVRGMLSLLPDTRPGNAKAVRSEGELNALFDQLTKGGTKQPPGRYPGDVFVLSDGTTVSRRSKSTSGGATIDVIYPSGGRKKVHIEP